MTGKGWLWQAWQGWAGLARVGRPGKEVQEKKGWAMGQMGIKGKDGAGAARVDRSGKGGQERQGWARMTRVHIYILYINSAGAIDVFGPT